MPGKKKALKPEPKEKSRIDKAEALETAQRALGYKAARTLLSELVVPAGLSPSKVQLEVVDEIIEQPGFFSYVRNGKTYYPTKAALLGLGGQQSVSEESLGFCYLSLITETSKTFDIDHVTPRAHFVEKEELLLKYLNTHQSFAEGFLGEQPQNAAHQEQINAYFKRYGGNIKATRWFCEVCYNSISNLTYLLHYINREKSAQLPADWLANSKLPEAFNEDLDKACGIQEGIIMQRVLKKTAGTDIEQIVLGKNKKGEEVRVYLHAGLSQGIGDFIRDWFQANRNKTIKQSGEIYQLKYQLTKTLVADANEERGPLIKLDKLLLTIKAAIGVMSSFQLRPGSSSDSDSTTEAKRRSEDVALAIKQTINYIHREKSMKKMLREIIADNYKEEFGDDFYKLWNKHRNTFLLPETQEEALKVVAEKCRELKTASRKLGKEEFLKFANELIEQVDPIKKAERERAGKIAAEKKAADAEKRADAEKKAAEAAEKRAAAAEQELKRLKEQTALAAASASGTSASVAAASHGRDETAAPAAASGGWGSSSLRSYTHGPGSRGGRELPSGGSRKSGRAISTEREHDKINPPKRKV